MNLERILKLIREFKETEDYEKLNVLEETIIEEIKLKKVAETTSKTRYNRAARVLKRNKNRPILQHTVERNSKQYFTDSYVLFELANKIPELPIVEKESAYPTLNGILEYANNDGIVGYNCKELKQMIKIADKYVVLELDGTYKAVVEKNLLLDVLIILDYKNSEDVIINYSTITKAHVIMNNCTKRALSFKRGQDRAVLMPIVVADEIAEKLGINKIRR